MGRAGRPAGAIRSLGSLRRGLASSLFDFRPLAALHRSLHRLLAGIRHLQGVELVPVHFRVPG